MAELDSALNKWVDSVPDHRAFITVSAVPSVDRLGHHKQCDGIRTGRILHSSTNLRRSMERITRFKYSCTDHSSHLHASHPRYRSRRWLSVPMRHGLVYTFWTFSSNAAANCCTSTRYFYQKLYERLSALTYQSQMCLFTSGVVLLQNIWAGKRLGLTIDPNKEMAEVHKCMKMLKSIELQSFLAGRLL